MQEKEKYIKTELVEMWIQDGIIYANYLNPTVVDLNISKHALRCREEISENKAYPILGDCRNIKYWSIKAKQHHASPEYGRLVKAVAMVIRSPMVSVFLNIFGNFYPVGFPVRSFTSEEEALEWLRKYK